MSFYNSIKLIINSSIIIIIGIVIKLLIDAQKVNKLNRRLGKYSIESKKNKDDNFFEKMSRKYINIQEKMLAIISKSSFLVEYGKRYTKYINKRKNPNANPMNYVVAKIVCCFFFLVLFLFSAILQKSGINISVLLLALLLGFYLPDLFLIGKKKMLNREIKNDLLQAITIMNNSFKAGRSIMQTIKIVSEEIDGPLKEEFSQMLIDLNYGLTIEDVFKRLEDRTNLDEVKYISTSLMILNKTGGNIIKVFSSIEKTFFNNCKLEDELNNLTAASKFLYRVLMFVPIVFVFLIYLLDPTYFQPLFKTTLGYIIISIIIFIYVSYILVIKRIIRIKE